MTKPVLIAAERWPPLLHVPIERPAPVLVGLQLPRTTARSSRGENLRQLNGLLRRHGRAHFWAGAEVTGVSRR